ncbi:hypothetical protein EJB05_34671 [Eragrostis curvula]|uniref:DUF7910 domain-containing protein n=1 Tax=Eragrostis curvula TaxID=38414 RepID=A0A5J9U4R4_9POAL|nr:hypothetical protein EJB05_34671 [Eragrostis curvula]
MGCRDGGVKRLCLLLLLLLCAAWLCSLAHGARTKAYPALPVRAACLGGWLVTEGWILPPLFNGIPNKDLLDGTQVQFKSALRKTYITADQGGGGAVVANKTQASAWETFKVSHVS